MTTWSAHVVQYSFSYSMCTGRKFICVMMDYNMPNGSHWVQLSASQANILTRIVIVLMRLEFKFKIFYCHCDGSTHRVRPLVVQRDVVNRICISIYSKTSRIRFESSISKLESESDPEYFYLYPRYLVSGSLLVSSRRATAIRSYVIRAS